MNSKFRAPFVFKILCYLSFVLLVCGFGGLILNLSVFRVSSAAYTFLLHIEPDSTGGGDYRFLWTHSPLYKML